MADETDSGSEYDFLPREEPERELPEPKLPKRPPEEPVAQRPARIEPERVCPHCGFEIFGKPRGGRCPDCAAPLDLTATDLLQFADGDWVRTLSNATLLLALGVLLDVGAVAIGRGGLPGVGALGHVAAAAVGGLGIWIATTEERGIGVTTSPTALPARMTSVALLGVWVVAMLMEWRDRGTAVKGLAIAALALYAIEGLLIAFHLQRLARRIPSNALGAQAVNVAWLLGGVCLVLIPAQAYDVGLAQTMYIFVCVFPLGGLALGVFVWAIVVLVRLGLDLRNAAAAGESIAIRKAQRLAQKK